MARKCSYTKRDLIVVCSRFKTSIEKDLKSGVIDKKKITKSYVYNEIAKRLKLSSSASFYKKGYIYHEQLEKWYIGFCKSIDEITPPSVTETKSTISSENNPINNHSDFDLYESNSEETNKLRSKIKEQDELIKYLNNVIKELRMENESLRLSRISKLHKLDADRKSDILDESLDSVEIKHLYTVIKKLYDSAFQK